MATKKAGGSTRNGRDSEAKRLGVKRFGGESVLAGMRVLPFFACREAARLKMRLTEQL